MLFNFILHSIIIYCFISQWTWVSPRATLGRRSVVVIYWGVRSCPPPKPIQTSSWLYIYIHSYNIYIYIYICIHMYIYMGRCLNSVFGVGPFKKKWGYICSCFPSLLQWRYCKHNVWICLLWHRAFVSWQDRVCLLLLLLMIPIFVPIE